MKENMKKVYLAPEVQAKLVAVENGFQNSHDGPGSDSRILSTEDLQTGSVIGF